MEHNSRSSLLQLITHISTNGYCVHRKMMLQMSWSPRNCHSVTTIEEIKFGRPGHKWAYAILLPQKYRIIFGAAAILCSYDVKPEDLCRKWLGGNVLYLHPDHPHSLEKIYWCYRLLSATTPWLYQFNIQLFHATRRLSLSIHVPPQRSLNYCHLLADNT